MAGHREAPGNWGFATIDVVRYLSKLKISPQKSHCLQAHSSGKNVLSGQLLKGRSLMDEHLAEFLP